MNDLSAVELYDRLPSEERPPSVQTTILLTPIFSTMNLFSWNQGSLFVGIAGIDALATGMPELSMNIPICTMGFGRCSLETRTCVYVHERSLFVCHIVGSADSLSKK